MGGENSDWLIFPSPSASCSATISLPHAQGIITVFLPHSQVRLWQKQLNALSSIPTTHPPQTTSPPNFGARTRR
jgi:hypothetical protein